MRLAPPAAQAAAGAEVAELRRLGVEAMGRIKKLVPQSWLEFLKKLQEDLDRKRRIPFFTMQPGGGAGGAPVSSMQPRELHCGACGSMSLALQFCGACRAVAYCRCVRGLPCYGAQVVLFGHAEAAARSSRAC